MAAVIANFFIQSSFKKMKKEHIVLHVFKYKYLHHVNKSTRLTNKDVLGINAFSTGGPAARSDDGEHRAPCLPDKAGIPWALGLFARPVTAKHVHAVSTTPCLRLSGTDMGQCLNLREAPSLIC
jgi:hypothetical protein